MDLSRWLRSLGLEQYEAAFRENEIDDAILPKLTADDLKDLGVTVVGHRRKLLEAIASLAAAAEAKAPPPDTTSRSDAAITDSAERRQVTVMFSDLVGSTALSARMDPEDLREVIAGYQNCVADTVRRSGGFVAKYLGDGVLVYFGYPQAHEDDAERAVRAGLQLVSAVAALKTTATLQTRVGIATGLVVVGDLIGSGEAQERGIVGETPNLAARLQGMAEPDTVVVADTTRKLLGTLFELEDLGAKDLKGVSGRVQAWAALRASSVESRFEALHGSGLTALVGREEELELLQRRWSKAKFGEGQAVLLSGEPGIGKSRLTAAFEQRLQEEPHARLRYFCSSHHTDSAFYPVATQLERAAGFDKRDAPEAKLEKLASLLGAPSRHENDTQLLAELLSIPTAHRFAPLNWSPQLKKEKTFEALLRQLQTLARRLPVLMIFEDVHWIDPTSLELLARSVRSVGGQRVLLLITARPEFVPPWPSDAHVNTVTLTRLSRRDAAVLVARVTEGKELPEEVMSQILARTDGVPLFIEELTKTVLELGLLRDVGERFELTGSLPMVAIPTTLYDALMARLDRFTLAKEVAQIGAVIGREFSYELLAAVAEWPEARLRAALDQLAASELVFRHGSPPASRYGFKHVLVQDAAYRSLLRPRREQLHSRIAEALESRFPEMASEVLAHHFTEAGLREQAVARWYAAGRSAADHFAYGEALAHLQRGLDVLRGAEQAPWCVREEIRLQNALGVALCTARGLVPQAEQAHHRARELSRNAGEPEELCRAIFGLWMISHRRGDLERAAQLSRELLSTTEHEKDAGRVLQAHHTAWTTAWQRGDFEATRRYADVGVRLYEANKHHQLAESYGGHDAGVCCRHTKGFVSWLMGYPDEAIAWAKDSVQLAGDLGHPHSLGLALAYGSFVHQFRREPQLVEQQGRALVELAVERGIPVLAAYGQVHRAWLLLARDEADAAVSEVGKAIAGADALGSKSRRSFSLALLAQAHLRAGRYDEGLVSIAKAFDFVHQSGERWWEAELHRVQAELLLARSVSDWPNAEACCLRALDVARHQRARSLELRAASSLARLWRDQGKRAEAHDLLAPIYDWFTEGFDTLDLKEAKALLAELS